MDVNTEEVNEDRAEDINGEEPCPGGNSPKVENKLGGGAPGLGPGLVIVG